MRKTSAISITWKDLPTKLNFFASACCSIITLFILPQQSVVELSQWHHCLIMGTDSGLKFIILSIQVWPFAGQGHVRTHGTHLYIQPFPAVCPPALKINPTHIPFKICRGRRMRERRGRKWRRGEEGKALIREHNDWNV